MKQRRGVYVILFVICVVIIGLLATGWNVKVVDEYRRLVANKDKLLDSAVFSGEWYKSPQFSSLWGSVGFLATLAALALFFVRLLKEMRLSQQQSEFLAAVTHELKTPLAAIELSASLIRSGGLEEEESRRLWSAHDRELVRLREQIALLLEAAKWQGSAPKPEPIRFKLEDWIKQSWQRWVEVLGEGAFLERSGAAVEIDVELDPKMLDLISGTIMDNARKFSRGTPKVTVRTEVRGAGSRLTWKIAFEDSGWGFAKEDSERIFKRFMRARTSSPFAVSGTGLGLYIAASASRASGLLLSAESEGERRGATFTLQGKTVS